MHFQRQRSGVLVQRVRGASAVELAILLAAVAGMLLLAAEVVGISTRSVYDSLAIAPGFGPPANPLQPAELLPEKAFSSVPPRRMLLTAAGALFALALWLRRRPRSDQENPFATEPASELPPQGLRPPPANPRLPDGGLAELV